MAFFESRHAFTAGGGTDDQDTDGAHGMENYGFLCSRLGSQ